MTDTIRVLLADDQRVVREGLGILLGLLADRRRTALAVGALAIGLGLLALYPAAAANAWARFLFPWRDTPRYTFAMVDGLPDRLVVAHGETVSLPVKLAGWAKRTVEKKSASPSLSQGGS